jgi:hypothetical protein
VTAGPGDQKAAAAAADGRSGGRLRASHADREHVIDALKAAFVQSRLTRDEFDARVGRALTSAFRFQAGHLPSSHGPVRGLCAVASGCS